MRGGNTSRFQLSIPQHTRLCAGVGSSRSLQLYPLFSNHTRSLRRCTIHLQIKFSITYNARGGVQALRRQSEPPTSFSLFFQAHTAFALVYYFSLCMTLSTHAVKLVSVPSQAPTELRNNIHTRAWRWAGRCRQQTDLLSPSLLLGGRVSGSSRAPTLLPVPKNKRRSSGGASSGSHGNRDHAVRT